MFYQGAASGGPEDECRCGCHRPGRTMLHCAPCCHDCPECGVRVPAGLYRDHVRLCSLRPERLSVAVSTADIDLKERRFAAFIDAPSGADRSPYLDHASRGSSVTTASPGTS